MLAEAEEQRKDPVFTTEEDAILRENRQLRKTLLGLLTVDDAGKTRVPGPTSDKILLAQLLDGMDKEAVTRAKLRIATKANDNAANLNQLAARALMNHRVPTKPHSTPQQRTLPETVTVDNPIEGETHIGIRNFSIDEILQGRT